MEKVIQALQLRQNALLESPTGTGKTLCLLCATLGWQKHLQDQFNKGGMGGATGAAAANGGMKNSNIPNMAAAKPTVPMIIYASRTHSQLAQVVDELRSSSYRPKMTVLGSREQLCVHDKVSKLKGAVMNHACNTMNAKHACSFKNGLDTLLPSGGTITGSVELEITDIEDLVRAGKKQRLCPYFYTRDISQGCNIVFMPYNYLLDSSIRKTLKVSWENAIVIFDEAHNLERVASDAASFSFSTAEIAACIEELQNAVRILRDSAIEQKRSDSAGGSSNGDLFGAGGGGAAQRPTLENAVNLLQSMFSLEKKIDSLQLVKEYGASADKGASITLPGLALIDMFASSGFMQMSETVCVPIPFLVIPSSMIAFLSYRYHIGC
jgi:regulator of telomere elongation helicase 1